ncbi:hypothetical protein J6590_017219 [Homalodisca vitripennis]|nr:hypothetical protein J6590_017219 [Homalodisca vitripennis]
MLWRCIKRRCPIAQGGASRTENDVCKRSTGNSSQSHSIFITRAPHSCMAFYRCLPLSVTLPTFADNTQSYRTPTHLTSPSSLVLSAVSVSDVSLHLRRDVHLYDGVRGADQL